jgi:hypothetical protein
MGEARSADRLDEVARLRILARTLDGTFVEREMPYAPAAVWNLASDLENELPRLIPHFRKVRIVDPGSARVRLDIRGYLGTHGAFEATVEPFFWLMQGKHAIGGMAVTPAPGGSRVAFLGVVQAPGYKRVRPLLRPVMRRQASRVLGRLEKHCRAD